MKKERFFKTKDQKIVTSSELSETYFLLTGNHLDEDSDIVSIFNQIKEEIDMDNISIVELFKKYPEYKDDDFEFLSELLLTRIHVFDSDNYTESISGLLWDIFRGYYDITNQDEKNIKDEAGNDGRLMYQSLMTLNRELRRPYHAASYDEDNESISESMRELFKILSRGSSTCKIHLHNGYTFFYSYGYKYNHEYITYDVDICNGLLEEDMHNDVEYTGKGLSFQEFLILIMEYLLKPRVSIDCLIVKNLKSELISGIEETFDFVNPGDELDKYFYQVGKNDLVEFIFRYNINVISGGEYIPWDKLDSITKVLQ